MTSNNHGSRTGQNRPNTEKRLSELWGWNLPFPEFSLMVLGIFLQILVPGETSWGGVLGSLLLLGGIVALVVGVPLVLTSIKPQIADIIYIVGGAGAFWYANTDAAELNGSVYILLFPSFGFMMAGASYLLRRSIVRATLRH